MCVCEREKNKIEEGLRFILLARMSSPFKKKLIFEESKCYHLHILTKDKQLFSGNSVELATSFRTTAFI